MVFEVAMHVFGDLQSICIISHRHKGIDAAFDELPELAAPRVQRRYCLQHIWSNLMTNLKNKRLKSLVWETRTTSKQRKWNKVMGDIYKISEGAHTYLRQIPPAMWELCYDEGHRFGIMTTNSSKSFNNTLKGCRMLSVTGISRLTFHKCKSMYVDRRTTGELMFQAGLLWPKNVYDEMVSQEKQKYTITIQRYNDQLGIYVVALELPMTFCGQLQFVIMNLGARQCSFGQWETDGLPCARVHAACHFNKTFSNSFVPSVYSLKNYGQSYSRNLNPLLPEEE